MHFKCCFGQHMHENSKDCNDSETGYNKELVCIMWCSWMNAVLMVYSWRKWWLFDDVKGHKYILIRVQHDKRFENCLGGPIGQEHGHLWLYISSNMMVNPMDK